MQLDEISDRNLVKRAQAGDRTAYESLITRYYQRIYGVCLGIVADSHESQDLCQETMLQGYMNIVRLRKADRFGAWIAKIAKNLCFEWLRKQKLGQKSRAQLAERFDNPKTDDLRDNDDVSRAIAKLPLELRMPLLMYYFDGRDSRSISQQLGVSHSSLWRRLQKAKLSLHELLTEVENEI